MLNLNRIEEKVQDLLENRFGDRESFTEDELADAAVRELKVTDKDDIRHVRKETELILRAGEDFFVSGGKVYPKANFFENAEFRVVPCAGELERAVLIPAAAFVPFCSEELFPDEFTFTDEDGTEYPMIEITARYSDIAPAFTMLGASGVIDYLSAECEENRLQMRSASALETVSVRVSAVDLGDFYRRHQFQEGDALIVRVIDWVNGCFEVRLQREADAPQEDEKKNFVRDFERALIRVCETERDYMEIPHQVAEAYLFAFEDGCDLRSRPVLSLEEYHHRMSEIGIRRDGSEWLLVPVDELDTPGQFEQSLLRSRAEHDAKMEEHDHEPGCGCGCGHDHHEHEHKAPEPLVQSDPRLTLDPDLSPEKFSASAGTLESIDAILAELNAPVNSVELGAMIFDALGNGEENFEDFRARTMDFLNLTFADDAQETAFINFLEDNWELSKEYFSPAEDAKRAPLRTRLLDLTKARIDLSFRLLERFKAKGVPKEIAGRLSAIHRDMVDTLSFLNSDTRIEDDARYEQLELRVGDIEDAWDDFTAQYER